MTTPRELFVAHATNPEVDSSVDDLRSNLTKLKLEALGQVGSLDAKGVSLVMPGLYEQIVVTKVQIAGHVGLGVAMALGTMDEHFTDASLSKFNREVREQMTEMAVNLKRKQTSRLAKMVAEIEAQRLALRHSHEFMSWLAFRRDDDRYPPADRLNRLNGFKVEQRLLQSRDVLIGYLGVRLAAALEGCDRFMLANRWRLHDSPENSIERKVWPLLSFQSGETVLIERARWEHDALAAESASTDELDELAGKIGKLLQKQLEMALGDVPDTATAGHF